MQRLKKSVVTVLTREGAATSVQLIAGIVNQIRLETERQNAEIEEVKRRHQETLDRLTARLEPLRAGVIAWAEANPAEFSKTRSIEFAHGIVGFRVGNPTLKTLRGWTWDRVLEAIRTVGYPRFIRRKEEVDKARILAEREALGADAMALIGVRVEQADEPFIEPKLEEPVA